MLPVTGTVESFRVGTPLSRGWGMGGGIYVFGFCAGFFANKPSDNLRSVTALPINDAPHTPSRIIAIAVPPGDEMNMSVEYSLPG